MSEERPYPEIGARLKEFRKQNKIKQTDFIEALNQMQATTSKIESGKILPNITYLIYLAENYGLNINWALTGQGSPKVGKTDTKGTSVLEALSRVGLLEQRFEALEKRILSILEEG